MSGSIQILLIAAGGRFKMRLLGTKAGKTRVVTLGTTEPEGGVN